MTIEISRDDNSLFKIQEYDRFGRKIEGEPVTRKAYVEADFNQADIETDVGTTNVQELSPDLQKPGGDETRGYVSGYLPYYTWQPLTKKAPKATIGGVRFRYKK